MMSLLLCIIAQLKHRKIVMQPYNDNIVIMKLENRITESICLKKFSNCIK